MTLKWISDQSELRTAPIIPLEFFRDVFSAVDELKRENSDCARSLDQFTLFVSPHRLFT